MVGEMKRIGTHEGQESENNIDDGAALWCRSDPRRRSWERDFLGVSVITESSCSIALADLTASGP